jgi:hypothetical protein
VQEPTKVTRACLTGGHCLIDPPHRYPAGTTFSLIFTRVGASRARHYKLPPGPEALTISAELVGHHGRDVVVDLYQYALLA